MDKSKINMHKRMAMGMREGGMGGRSGSMMYSRGYGVGEKNKRMPTMLKDRGPTNMKKGGKVHSAVLGALMMKKFKHLVSMLRNFSHISHTKILQKILRSFRR